MDQLLAVLLQICIIGHSFSETITPENAEEPELEAEVLETNFYSFTVQDVHGDQVSLEKYRGKVSLIVNVASECGFTDNHYKGLVKLQKIFSSTRKFNVLAFPSNDFGQQEPKEDAAIHHFAEERYQVNFPIFSKIHVVGDETPEPWQYIIEKSQLAPNWNFWKYLIDQNGHVVGAWGPWTDVEDITSLIKDAVDTAMKATGPKRPMRGNEAMEPFMGNHDGVHHAEGAQYENRLPGEQNMDRRAGEQPQPPEPVRIMPPEMKKPKPVESGPEGVHGPKAPAGRPGGRSQSSAHNPPAPAERTQKSSDSPTPPAPTQSTLKSPDSPTPPAPAQKTLKSPDIPTPPVPAPATRAVHEDL